MSGIAHVSAASVLPSSLPARSAGKASTSSGLGAGSSNGASGDTTTTITNADGSLTINVVNAAGQIVSSSTSGATNTLVSVFGGSGTAGAQTGTTPASLLNLLV